MDKGKIKEWVKWKLNQNTKPFIFLEQGRSEKLG
jgi:hypothetical protein